MKKISVRGYNHGRTSLNAPEEAVSAVWIQGEVVMKKTMSFALAFAASILAFLALDIALLYLQGLSFIFKG